MNKKTLKAIIIMGLSSVIGYFVSMFLTSYITENIGIEAYGFVSIAKTVVNYGEIVTIALTSFVVRYITIHYYKNEIKEAQSYYVSSINASLVLCLILTVVFAIIVANLELLIVIPDYLIATVKLLFVAVFAAFLSTTLSTPFSVGFYTKNRLDLSGIIKIISYISEIIVLLLMFKLFKPALWFVGLGSFAASATVLLGNVLANRRLAPDFRYDKSLHSNKKVKTLIGNGFWNSVNQLGNTLNSGLDLLVSNAMLTGIQTGQIAVAKSIGAIFSTLSGIIFQPLQPELLRTYSEGINKGFLNQLKKSMKLCGFFGSLVFSGFLGLGSLFYRLWLPSQDSKLLHVLTLVTVFTFIMDLLLQPIYYVNTLTVKNKIPCLVTIAGGLLNVAGMYFLIKYTNMGVYSVPITTAVIMSCINFFFNPMYATWCLKIKKTYFYPLIFRHLFATAVMCTTFWGINKLINPCSWIGLIVCALLMVCIGAAIYFAITFNKDERIAVISTIKKKLIKK